MKIKNMLGSTAVRISYFVFRISYFVFRPGFRSAKRQPLLSYLASAYVLTYLATHILYHLKAIQHIAIDFIINLVINVLSRQSIYQRKQVAGFK